MKKKFILTLSCVPLLLTSCLKNKNAIIIPFNMESDVSLIESNASKIASMIENNYSFMVYEYSSACSMCKETSTNFDEFLKKNNYVIYKFDAYMDEGYQDLMKLDEINFPELISTPRVLIIKDGRVIDEVNPNKLTQKSLFSSSIKAFVKENKHLYMSFTLNGYKDLVNKKESINTVIINTVENKNLDTYIAKYQDLKLKEDYVFIDEAYASNELLNYLNQ